LSGTSLEVATRGDLEAFLGDLLSRRKASTAATYHKVLKILYGWLRRALDRTLKDRNLSFLHSTATAA
jgi:hypothetical protein